MILTGTEIQRQLGGNIVIDPFDISQLNPNSYNLRLHDEIMVYADSVLDVKKDNPTKSLLLPRDGMELVPGELYLARTLEYTETRNFVPMIVGRSSIGRLGISVHATSGFGDVGFCGHWTLQLTCVKRTRIYPFMRICQIYYQDIKGDAVEYDSAKYQNSAGIVPSKAYLDFE